MENDILEDKDIYGLDTPKVSPFKTALKWGVIGGIVFIIASLIKFLLAENYMATNWVDNVVQYAILLGIVIMAQIDHKKNDLNGSMSYGRSLGVGVLAVLFASIILAIYSAVFMSYILPENMMEVAIQDAILKAQESVEQNGMEMTDQIAASQEKWIRFMFQPSAIIFMVILGLGIMGTIFSLITSIFIKKN